MTRRPIPTVHVHTGKPETHPKVLAREPIPVGREITATIDGTWTTVALARLADTRFRVVVLDGPRGKLVDRAYAREFDAEPAARECARRWTRAFRPPGAAVLPTVRNIDSDLISA